MIKEVNSMTEFWIAIATLIGAILIFIQTNKSQKVTYLSEEEAKWRENLREIIISLRSSDEGRIIEELNRLTPLLNPLGKVNKRIGNRQAYSVDSHIWLLREQIVEKFEKDKLKRLIDYLELLLKFDWEESKYKLRYKLFDFFIIFTLIFYCLLFILWIIQPEWISIDGEPISVIIPLIGLFMVLLAFGIFWASLKDKIFLGLNTAINGIDNFFTILFIFCYILPVVGLIFRYNEKIVEILQKLSFLSDINKSKLTYILIGLMFVFEIVFLSISVSFKNKYYLSILGADYPYLTQKLNYIYRYLQENHDNYYLLKAHSKLEKYFSRKESADIPTDFDLGREIDNIDLTYLWKLTAYKKIIKQLLRYRKYGNEIPRRFYAKNIKEKWNNVLEKLKVK